MFTKRLLVPETGLRVRDTVVNKPNKNACPHGAHILITYLGAFQRKSDHQYFISLYEMLCGIYQYVNFRFTISVY